MIAGSPPLDLVKHLQRARVGIATSHEVRLSKIEAGLQSGGRSPNEQAMKVRLRELLGLG